MACVYFYKNQGYEIECVFCDYGQPAAKYELMSATRIAKYYGVSLYQITVTESKGNYREEICARNAMLAIQAFFYTGYGAYKIITGIHDGTDYADCTKIFVDAINRVLDCYANGKVILEAPFIDMCKADIINYCEKESLPISMTYSCEEGCSPPCGKCPSCLDRKEYLNEQYVS